MIALRIVSATLLLCSIVYAPLVVTVVLACCYSLYFTAYELIVLGVLVDAFYSGTGGMPYYLVGGVSIFIFSEWIKPRLLMYNR